jgi:hypothetical protein
MFGLLKRFRMGAMVNFTAARRHGLDAEQSASLRRFIDDLGIVLAGADVPAEQFERSVCGLAAAYHAALVTRKWDILVAVLTDAIGEIDGSRYAADENAAGSYRRLRAIVCENADLLPAEMLRLTGTW